jgi:pimeloyl-ACP methyl ester carboxylesterase
MGITLGLPRLRDFLTEGLRATFEGVSLYLNRDELLQRTPPGDARPVLVLPGFGAGDTSTMVLRSFLKDKGFYAHGWKNGCNIGPDDTSLRQMTSRLDDVFSRYDGQKVTLIGHSLGGVYARELARAFPDKVDQVITLNSPFGADEHSELSIRLMLHLFHIAYGGKRDFTGRAPLTDFLTEPLPVPTTAIYSQTDGVVNWRQCINPVGKNCENVEALGSHIGMGMNLQSLLVIIDRLNQKSDAWAPFDRQKYPDAGFPERQGHESYKMPYKPKRPYGQNSKVFEYKDI